MKGFRFLGVFSSGSRVVGFLWFLGLIGRGSRGEIAGTCQGWILLRLSGRACCVFKVCCFVGI